MRHCVKARTSLNYLNGLAFLVFEILAEQAAKVEVNIFHVEAI